MKSPRDEQEKLRSSTETILYLEGGKVVRSQQRGLGRGDPPGGERKEIQSRKPGNKVEGEIPSVG